jgi:hypothetical protein
MHANQPKEFVVLGQRQQPAHDGIRQVNQILNILAAKRVKQHPRPCRRMLSLVAAGLFDSRFQHGR